MDTIATYRDIIERILSEYTQTPSAYGEIQTEVIAQHETDHYLLMAVGWQGTKRIHDCLIHTDIIDGKIWIQADGTEDGFANKLLEAGVPKDQVVLGFHPRDVRPLTGFAVE
jgi:hypothetical protein